MNKKPYAQQHRLTDVDLDEMVATCAVCGPVDVAPHTRKQHLVQCANGRALEMEVAAARNKKKLQDPVFRARKRELYHERHWLKALSGKYGVTVEYYPNKLEEQEGRCGICREVVLNDFGKYTLDHNHATGEPRGLLCNDCNALLGFAKEREQTLLNAIEYLRRYSKC